MNRRTFIYRAGQALAAVGPLATSAWSQPVGSNNAIRIGIIGLNGKGRTHIEQVKALSEVRLVALCDVDPEVLAARAAEVKKWNASVETTTDLRRLLERSDLDAVIIATCNHWHGLATIWACQAGKHVYVEKPLSHSIWEGQQMIKAARKYGRIVQVGTQFRSDAGLGEAAEFVRSGALGKVRYVHALYFKERSDIGKRLPWYPENLDYNLYCGPAPMEPLLRNQIHYDWHWNWNTGNGDLGNLGVHCVDIARRFILPSGLPRRVISVGGRFVHDDAAQTPNTQFTAFQYPEGTIYFETRGLPSKPGMHFMDQRRGVRQGVIVQCEAGWVTGYVGAMAFDQDGHRIRSFPGDGGAGHLANFVAAIRTAREKELAAPVSEGYLSTAACLLGNISYRVGRPATLSEVDRSFEAFPDAPKTVHELAAHLSTHGVSLERQPLQLGAAVGTDGSGEISNVASVRTDDLPFARFLLRGVDRPGFHLPEVV